jgi:hypothetical protein
MKYTRKFLLIIATAIWLNGCTPIATNIKYDQMPNDSTPAVTDLTPINSTREALITPSIPTEIKTQIPTEYSTQDPEQTLFQLQNLTIDDCNLPCIWGITPGLTTVKEFEELFLPLGTFEIIAKDYGAKYLLEIPVAWEDRNLRLVISTNLLIVTEVLVSMENYSYFGDHNWWLVLAPLGMPDEILIAQDVTQIPKYHRYQLVINYQSKGLYFILNGDSYAINERTAQICPLKENFLDLAKENIIGIIPDPKQKRIYSKIFNFYDSFEFMPLEEYETDLTKITFYERYIVQQDDFCFEISLYPPDS